MTWRKKTTWNIPGEQYIYIQTNRKTKQVEVHSNSDLSGITWGLGLLFKTRIEAGQIDMEDAYTTLENIWESLQAWQAERNIRA